MDSATLTQAIGRTQTLTDTLDENRAGALAQVLGRTADTSPGAPLPPFWHQIYFWQKTPAGALGDDGHPRTGDFIPATGLPQRMWAGGKLSFLHPLVIGAPAIKTSTIENVVAKQGASGPLVFVTIRHEISQADRLAVTEQQDLVYRAPDTSAASRPGPGAPADEDTRQPFLADVVTLFRYSALTFNGHRIHYDADFCRQAFGYPAPVVHGPLLAQSLITLAETEMGRLHRFEFRATAPLFAGAGAQACWRRDRTLWMRGAQGQLLMQARAS